MLLVTVDAVRLQLHALTVNRVWRREGLKVSRKHLKWDPLWLNDECCV
jgi:hypothetical protein